MLKTTNQDYYLAGLDDDIKYQSLPGWNGNFNKLDKTITALENNFDVATSTNGNNYTITDSASGYNKGNIKIGDGPELSQVTTTGKNLLNTKGGFTKAYISSTGVVTNDPKNALFDGYISVQANSNYTFSANNSIKALNVSYFDSNQDFISRNKVENQSSATITTPATAVYVRINVQYDDNNINQTIIDSLDMMFESGSTATSYEPYTGGATPRPDYPQNINIIEGSSTLNIQNSDNTKSQTYSIELPTGMFLGQIGTASNYIHGTKDNWKLHRGLSKTVLDENTTYGDGTSSGVYYVNTSISDMKRGSSMDGYCTHFHNDKSGRAINSIKFGNSSTSYTVFIYLDNTVFTSKAVFASWAGTNKPEIYYQLLTETETDITDSTLVTQLNNIVDNLLTYKGETVVFTTSDNLEPNVQFDYLVNPLASIEARLDLLEE